MKPFDLTILIPTIPARKELYDALEAELYRQIMEARKIYPEILVTIDNDPSEFERIGTKRNNLLERAISKYVAFFDDDDWPGENYILRNVEGIITGVDCCALVGCITWDGINPEYFIHSKDFNEYKTKETEGFYDAVNAPYETGKFSLWIKQGGCRSLVVNDRKEPVKYERYPNHLNCMKSSIAKQFKFPEINHGEDTDWATQVFNSGLIQTEHYIDEVIYHYRFKPNK